MQKQQEKKPKNHKLKLEIDKVNSLIQASISKRITPDMAVGLLSFTAAPNVKYEALVKISTTIQKKVQFFFSLSEEKAITKQNISELIAYVKYKAIQNKKAFSELGSQYVLTIIDEVLSELVLDNSYIRNHYVQLPKSKSHQKNQKINNRHGHGNGNGNLGIQCPMCLVEIQHQNLSLLSCGHSFHRTCFRKYTEFKIKQKSFPVICPIQQCKKAIPTKDIQQQIDGQILQKFYQFTFQNYVEKNVGNTSWCPTPGCTSVFSYDEILQQYRCPACKKNYCLKCKCEMHFGVSCQQYRLLNNLSEYDKAFIEFAKGAKYKQCPKCRFWVQKNQGCDHMTCRCKYQFCYKCGQAYGTCDCDQDESYNSHIGQEQNLSEDIQDPAWQNDELIKNDNSSSDEEYDGVYESKIAQSGVKQ